MAGCSTAGKVVAGVGEGSGAAAFLAYCIGSAKTVLAHTITPRKQIIFIDGQLRN
jgi:hypothetical protein